MKKILADCFCWLIFRSSDDTRSNNFAHTFLTTKFPVTLSKAWVEGMLKLSAPIQILILWWPFVKFFIIDSLSSAMSKRTPSHPLVVFVFHLSSGPSEQDLCQSKISDVPMPAPPYNGTVSLFACFTKAERRQDRLSSTCSLRKD